MKRSTWVLIAVLGGGASLCCVTSGLALAVLGATPSGEGAAPGASGGGTGLEGSWMHGSAGLTQYRDLATGAFAPPSGTGEAIDLAGDGSCTHSAVLQSTVYNCTSYIFTYSDECEWSLDGATLTLEIGAGTLRSRMCGGEVKEGESKARTLRYAASLSVDEGGTWLTLVGEDGDSRRFHR